MTRFRFSTRTALVLGFLTLAIPYTAYGATIGTIVPQLGSSCYCPGSAPDYGCVLQLIQNLINAAVQLGVILCVVWIAIAGFSLMISGGKPEALSQAKTRLTNAILGIAIILCSWIIVDFVMKTIYDPNKIFQGENFGPWNSILAPGADSYCIKETTPNAVTSGTVDILTTATPGTSTGGGGSGSGSCTVRASGPCSVDNLKGAFGSAANEASQICSAESGNGTLLKGDRTTEGNPVSFGLFQINITAHKVGGLNCPAAFDSLFTGSHKNVKIINNERYIQCRDAALNPSTNIAYAASLYKRDKNSWRQWSTGKKCGLAVLDRVKFTLYSYVSKSTI